MRQHLRPALVGSDETGRAMVREDESESVTGEPEGMLVSSKMSAVDQREPAPSTAAVCDAADRLGIELPPAMTGLLPVGPAHRVVGLALPGRVEGTPRALLALLAEARGGEVLVIDNDGRTDEACVGDVMAARCRDAGLSAIVAWGMHRDTARLREIGLPVFSLGPTPRRAGSPTSASRIEAGCAMVGGRPISRSDVVFADDDGVLFVRGDQASRLLAAAALIEAAEAR